MDKERHRVNGHDGGDARRSTHEVNSNTSFMGKRKKMRNKKQKHCAYLQEWLDKSCSFDEESEAVYASETEHHFVTNPSYWPSNHAIPRPLGQRLYASVSNPTMCHYSVPSMPLGYAIEPGSLPVYAMYPPSVQPSQPWRSPHSLNHSPSSRGQRLPKNIPPMQAPSHRSSLNSNYQGVKNDHSYSTPTKGSVQPPKNQSEEFASLPPQTEGHDLDPSKRRFSDPGLGPSPVGNGASYHVDGSSESDSSAGSSTNSRVIIELVEQINTLRNNNIQLSRELHFARNELNAVKLQAATWKMTHPEYQPGLLSDMVREVREAAQVREEAFLSRVRQMVGDSHWNVASSPMPGHSQADVAQKTSLGLATSSTDHIVKAMVDERLGRIEVHLQNLQIQASHKDCHLNPSKAELKSVARDLDTSVQPLPDQLVNLEKEKVELRCKLQAALDSRKAAEVHTQKLERLVCILRKKINGTTGDEQAFASLDQCPSSLENTSESLASMCSSSTGSAHSPQVTISGPVTDL